VRYISIQAFLMLLAGNVFIPNIKKLREMDPLESLLPSECIPNVSQLCLRLHEEKNAEWLRERKYSVELGDRVFDIWPEGWLCDAASGVRRQAQDFGETHNDPDWLYRPYYFKQTAYSYEREIRFAIGLYAGNTEQDGGALFHVDPGELIEKSSFRRSFVSQKHGHLILSLRR
jgi:hypothetical protein